MNIREMPLEILVKGESEPIYGFTTEECWRYASTACITL